MGRPKRSAPRAPAPTPHAAPATEARLDGVYNAFTGLGGQYDKGAASRPSTSVNPLTDQELRASYLYSGLPRRIVDVLPQKATRKGWSAPDVPSKEEDRLRVWERYCEGMTLARLYGGAVGLMVTDDDVPPAFRARPEMWMREPLDLKRVGALRALHVFDALECRPWLFDEDLRSPGYRSPALWSISTGRRDLVVHSSRVIWFRGARRPTSELRGGWRRANSMPDDSILQAVWEEVARLLTVAQGGSILALELREAIVKVSGLAGIQASDQKAAFDARMRAMMTARSLLGLVILGENDHYESRSNNPQGWDKLHEGMVTLLCAALGWPRVMLTGEAPGGLSTDDKSGLERERQLVSDYQERHRPEITRLYEVLYASQDGPTGGQIPDEWTVTFAPLNEPTDAETAELRLKTAQMDVAYINAGVYTPEEIARQRFGPDGWRLDLEEVEVVDLEAETERAIEAARAELAAQGGNVATPPDPERSDAGDGWIVVVPVADLGLTSAVEEAIGQRLTVENVPHITVLYLGSSLPPEAPYEIGDVVADEARLVERETIDEGELGAFPPGSDGTPIVLHLEEECLDRLNGALLRRLAHLVTARQYARYRPHVTIGYAPAPLSTEALSRLAAIDTSGIRIPVASLEVLGPDGYVSTFTVGERPQT